MATWSELCGLSVGVLEDAATFEEKGSNFGRLYFPRAKKEEGFVGTLEVLDAEEVIGVFGDCPWDVFSFASALPDCFADLKPNAPREAIVAAWLAEHLNKLQRWRT